MKQQLYLGDPDGYRPRFQRPVRYGCTAYVCQRNRQHEKLSTTAAR